jgi:hypothetical protein
MRLVIVSFLAALVVAPLAAQAAQAPARYSVALDGRIVATYSYMRSTREFECQISRFGSATRTTEIRSVRPTVLLVARDRGRAAYRPAILRALRLSATTGGSNWTERRVCRGAPIETRQGTCAPKDDRARAVRAQIAWGGPNRIAFRPDLNGPATVPLCGLGQSVRSNGRLSIAPGRVDEEGLLLGRARRLIANALVTRDGNIASDPQTSIGEKIEVRWTLTFRRLR